MLMIFLAGTVTAGNASGSISSLMNCFRFERLNLFRSGINDGAAALILSSNRIAKLKQQIPLARIVSWAQTGLDPLVMVRCHRHVQNEFNFLTF